MEKGQDTRILIPGQLLDNLTPQVRNLDAQGLKRNFHPEIAGSNGTR